METVGNVDVVLLADTFISPCAAFILGRIIGLRTQARCVRRRAHIVERVLDLQKVGDRPSAVAFNLTNSDWVSGSYLGLFRTVW